MKLIHLSDLHIGKRLHEVSMLDEQAHILLRILQIIDDEGADAVLIAGDVYDKSTPSTEAITLFDDFLCRLAKRQLPVMIISGNHDSPERLAFGSRFLELGGIHVSPVYKGKVRSVTLKDRFGEVIFWLMPFVKPSIVKRLHPEAEIESYTDACRVVVEEMEIDPTKRNVLLAHQFVTGSVLCESEELSAGGAENVDAAVFRDFDYVALGHIHGPQNIGSNKIRYCGTPLKYSFSESHHHKSVTVVHLGAKGELELRLRPLTPRHDLREIRGTFEALMDVSGSTVTEDYVHIILTEEEDVPEAVGKLRSRYPNLMKLSYDNARTRMNQVIDGAVDVHRKSHLELFEELYALQNNQPMSPLQRDHVQALIASIWEECV